MSEGSERPVAVVTGALGGIGRAICGRLESDGFRVIGLDPGDGDTEGAGSASSPLPPRFARHPLPGGEGSRMFENLQCDVSDDAAVAEAVAAVGERYGRIDVAVHAAGISSDAVVWKLAVDDWDRVHAVNLKGAFLLIRHVMPMMRQRGHGRVVLIGSINGSRGKFGTAAYSASKAGLVGLAKTVARETGRFGVRINVVEPGWVVTPLTEAAPPEVKQKAQAETLLGELVEPDDVAAMVSFLCGEGGRRITGQILRVDAGQYLGSM